MLEISIDSNDIACNSLVSSGTLLTVPAGKQWSGTICLTATITLAGTCAPTVQTAGTGAAPSAGTVIARLNVTGLALTTANDSMTIDAVVRAPEGNDVTITYTQGASGTSTATANGIILP